MNPQDQETSTAIATTTKAVAFTAEHGREVGLPSPQAVNYMFSIANMLYSSALVGKDMGLSKDQISRLREFGTAPEIMEQRDRDAVKANSMAKMLVGHELGIEPMAALMDVDIVKAKVFIRYPQLHRLIEEKGYTITENERSHERAAITLTHPDKPRREFEFTIEDAKRAGLTKRGGFNGDSPSQYELRPRVMLWSRVISEAYRGTGGKGSVYTPEEKTEILREEISEPEPREAKAENPYVVAAKPAAEISPNAVNPAASANPESGNGGGAQSHQTAHSGGAGLVPDPPQAGRENSRDAHGFLANGPLGGEPSTAEAEISAPTSAPAAETTGKATGSPARELDELAETEEQTAQREHVAAMRNTASPSPDKTQEPSKVVEMPKAAPASLITEIAGFLGPNADKVTKEFLRGYLQSPLKNSNPRMVEGLTVLLAASKTHSQRLIQDPYGMGVIAATGWKAFQKFIEKWPKDCKEMATAFVLIRYADTAGGDFVELLQGAPVFGETMDKDEVRGFLNVLACCEWGTATKLREKALESGIPLHVILSRVEQPWNDGKILGLLAFSNGESATAGPGPSEPTDEGVDEDDIGLLFQAMRSEKP